jgi:Transglycosylase SLT domain
MLLRTIMGLRFPAFLAAAIAALPLAAASADPRASAAPPSMEVRSAPGAAVVADTGDETLESLCLMIEAAAKANDLPLEFFGRVIWREGHFEVSPTGPYREQRITGAWPVLDPFDPVQALPKAAEYLSGLRGQFGNLGLAVAAYHLGSERLQAWLAGTGAIPQETRDYVVAITGASI